MRGLVVAGVRVRLRLRVREKCVDGHGVLRVGFSGARPPQGFTCRSLLTADLHDGRFEIIYATALLGHKNERIINMCTNWTALKGVVLCSKKARSP